MDSKEQRINGGRLHNPWLVTIAILALLGLALAYDLDLERRKILSIEQDRLLVQARVIDDNLSYEIISTSNALRLIAEDLPHWRAGAVYAPSVNRLLKTVEESMPGVRTLFIMDAHGVIRASSRIELIGLDLSKREYFQTPLRHPDPSTLYLSVPFTTTTNLFAMTLSLIVPGPQGNFNGLLVATVDPEYFRTLLVSVQYAHDMWVAIAHGDGVQFMMVPDREGQAGKNLAQPGSFFSRHQASGKIENILSGTVYATGEQRLMAIRTIRPAGAHMDKPLIVAVGRDLHAVFADWRSETLIYGGIFFGIVVVTVLSLRYYQQRSWQADEVIQQAQEELRAREEKYKFLIDATATGYVIIDEEGRVVEANPEYVRMTGHARLEDIAGRKVTEWTAQYDLKRNAEEVKECFQRGFVRNLVIDYIDEEGRITPVEMHATVLAGPQTTRIFTICRDITERKRAEEDRRKTTALLRTFMNAISESVFLMDVEGRILAANETMAKRFGMSVENFVGMRLEEILQPEAAARRRKHIDEAVRTKKPVRFEDERTGRIVDNCLYPVFDAQGNVEALAIVGYDITERKRTEQEREQLIAELQKALAEIKTLQGILPICSHCKKIRDDKGAWKQMETYISEHTDALFSHGICSECAQKLYPDYFTGNANRSKPENGK